MHINTFLLWAVTVGGSAAALPRARVRQGDVHFIALTSKIYCMDKAGEEIRDGCACFLLLPPLSFPGNHHEFTRKCTDSHVCCQRAHAACGPCCRQAPGQSSQHIPGRPNPRGCCGGCLGAREASPSSLLGQRNLPRSDILEHRRSIFMFQGENLAERTHSALINILLLLI